MARRWHDKLADGTTATDLLARPTRWESNVWDLTNVRPLAKVLVGTMPDSVMYRWCRTVPSEDMPFVVSAINDIGTTLLTAFPEHGFDPPIGTEGPTLVMPCYRPALGRNELAAPTVSDEWANRLVYFLRE